MNRILLVGVARSGTTWVGTVLSKCGDTHFFNEPDDERRYELARIVKNQLTRYPTIAPGDSYEIGEADAGPYAHLWQEVWESKLAKNTIAKSVFLPFCLEWVKETFYIDHVVWIKRDLMNVVASWYEYSRVKHPHVDDLRLLRRLTWQAASHFDAYRRLSGLNFYTAEVDHLALVRNAEEDFAILAGALGLKWGHEALEQLADLNAAGVGGHYGLSGYDLSDHIRRSAGQVGETAWTEKLDASQAETVKVELRRWGLA